MEQKDFFKRLNKITDMLNTCYGQYTDTDSKDVRVYDNIQQLINNEGTSDYIKEELKVVQRKIRESYLTMKDLEEMLSMYE